FIQQQAPDVIEQYLRWHLAEGVLMTVFGVVALALVYPILRVTHKWVNGDRSYMADRDVAWIPAGLLTVACVFIGCICVPTGVVKTTKVLTAPKVVVMELVT